MLPKKNKILGQLWEEYLPNIFFVTGQEKVRNQAEGNWVETLQETPKRLFGKIRNSLLGEIG